MESEIFTSVAKKLRMPEEQLAEYGIKHMVYRSHLESIEEQEGKTSQPKTPPA